jgi:inner membrane protein
MNATEHRLTAACILAAAAGASTEDPKARCARGALAGLGGYCCGTLPDLIEPATHPHHRQFFHSVLFAVMVACAVYRLHHWEPETDGAALLRVLSLIAGGAYLAHLALDAGTPRSLPLIGRLPR